MLTLWNIGDMDQAVEHLRSEGPPSATRVPSEQAVHSLRHGFIWITYAQTLPPGRPFSRCETWLEVVSFAERGDFYQAYRTGQEEQLGAFGLVVNAIWRCATPGTWTEP